MKNSPETKLKLVYRKALQFDPELSEDFDAKVVLDQLLSHNGSSTTIPHKDIMERCNSLIDRELSEIKEEYTNIYKRIEREVEDAYKQFIKKLDIAVKSDKEYENIVREIFPSQFDIQVSEIINNHIIALIAIIRTILYKFTDIALYDVQLIAALKLYHKKVLEMKTGEGKTFVIPATSALYGIRAKFLNKYYRDIHEKLFNEPPKPYERFQIHIVTANDYLARRDYTLLHAFYSFFELSCFYIQEQAGEIKKQEYYSFDIVYCTCRHACHYSLYDIMKKDTENPYLSVFRYAAILDEIDQILLDEALTPHIISDSEVPENYKIDLIYQANHLANKFMQDRNMFVFQKERQRVELTELGTFFFSKLFIGFFNELTTTSLQKDKSEVELLSLEKWLAALSGDATIQELHKIKNQLMKQKPIRLLLFTLYDKLEVFLKEYLPFLLQVFQLRFENIYQYNDQAIAIQDLIDELQYIDQKLFMSNIIHELLSTDCRELKTIKKPVNQTHTYRLLSQAYILHKLSATKNIGEIQISVNCFFDFINSFLQNYKVLDDNKELSFRNIVYHLITTEFPAVFKHLSRGQLFDLKNYSYLSLEEVCQFINIQEDCLVLVKDLTKTLYNRKKFIKYLKAEFYNLDITVILNDLKIFDFLMKIFLFCYIYPVLYRFEGFQTAIENSRISSILKSESFKAIEEIREFMFKSLSDLNMITTIEENLPQWYEVFEQIFSEAIPDFVQIFFKELSSLFDEMNDKSGSFTEMQKIFAEMKKIMIEIRDQNDFLNAYATKIGILLHFFLKMIDESIPEKNTKESKDIRDVYVLNVATLISFFRVHISKDLFSKFAIESSQSLDYIDKKHHISAYFEKIILNRIINPFSELKDELFIITPDNIPRLLQLLMKAGKNSSLKEFLEDQNWLISSPFYEIWASDSFFKNRRLKSSAKTASAFYFDLLKQFNFARNTNVENFFILVQRSFNVLSFYENKADYIISSIDFNREPYKKRFDPYLRQYEKNEVQIIDQITGRVLINNRWSRYLHSCVEAKENLLIKGESRASSQVTPQSYFGSYRHLMGLSGTTIVAKKEFSEKYQLQVEYIPTNQPTQRIQLPDKICLTRYGALKEMMFDALGIYYTTNAPVLFIVENIDDAELVYQEIQQLYNKIEEITQMFDSYCRKNSIHLSKGRMTEGQLDEFAQIWNTCFKTDFDRTCFQEIGLFLQLEEEKISFEDMLIAYKQLESTKVEQYTPQSFDYHFLDICLKAIINGDTKRIKINCDLLDGRPENLSRESEIIKKAGYMGSILISTRVAGRGTDIKLTSHWEKVHPGLYTLIFNHQESKRHDQQIYGRCGRQGDLGHYRFYNSWESGWFQNVANQMKDKLKMDMNMMPLYLKLFSFNEFNNEIDDEFGNELLAQMVSTFQLDYEQGSHIKRIHEKRLGDMAMAFQAMLVDIDCRNICTEIDDPEYNNLFSKNNHIDIQYQEICFAGMVKYCLTNQDILERSINPLIDEILFLTNCGYEQAIIVDNIETFLFINYYEDIKPWEAHLLEKKLQDLVQSIIDKAEKNDKKESTIWKLSDIHKERFSEELRNEILVFLQPEKTVSKKDEIRFLKYFFQLCMEDQHIGQILKLIINESLNSKRNAVLKLYNGYVEIFRSENAFSPFVNMEEIFKKFKETSEELVFYFNTQNCISIYIFIKIILSLIESMGKPESTSSGDFQGVPVLSKMGINIRDYLINNKHNLLLKEIISYFRLPVSSTRIVSLINNIQIPHE